ncbi:MAG: DNA-binding HxlR family transcriptional regulator [Paracoccaceae bacterium]|jgi:DNA-binding HxlR family transcriptional regulator
MTVDKRDNCPVLRATNVIGDQWSLLILREFFLEGPRRFQDLQDVLGVSPNTLSTRLKKLEQGGVLDRHVYTQNPPRSEYRLTEAGQALAPMMSALRSWGQMFTPDLPK